MSKYSVATWLKLVETNEKNRVINRLIKKLRQIFDGINY